MRGQADPAHGAARGVLAGVELRLDLMGAGELLRSNALDPASLFDHEEKLVHGDLFEDFA